MINAFTLEQGRLQQVHIDSLADLQHCSPVWVDFVDASDEELSWAQVVFGFRLPDEADSGDIEASARFFEEPEGVLHIRTDFILQDDEGGSTNVRVAFVIRQDVLFSVHGEDLPVFRLLRMRARRQPGYVNDAKDVLLELYSADVEYSADALEEMYARLDEVSQRVLDQELNDSVAASILASIAKEEDLNGRIRRNVMDTRRAVSFLMRARLLGADQFEDARQILRDIESLDSHTAFLFDKLNFLMDATVGFVNINQNKIIKIFSVASVAMLPPTLIASIYGMNFQYMPELGQEWGYPFALALMAISVVLPFWWFHRKGWLR
jgi:magnesium transporter